MPRRVDRHVVRGAGHPARDGHEPRDGAARGEARRLHPRADPRDGVHRDDRRAHARRPAAARLRRGRPRDDRARHAHVLRRAPREPGRGGCRSCRRALPSLERPPVSARGAAGRAPPRGRGRRRPCPDDAAARPERSLEGASGRPAAARRPPSGRRRGRVLSSVPGRDDPELGRRHRLHRPGVRGPRPEPELARGLGAGGRPARRRALPRVRTGGACARRGDRGPAEHHELRRLPHVLRRPPPPVLRTHGRGLPDARPARVQAHGRGGDAPHRLSRDLDLPRLQVRPEDGDPRRRRRLGLRLPRRLRMGDGVLEPAARGRPLRLPLHRLAPRAPARGRPRVC